MIIIKNNYINSEIGEIESWSSDWSLLRQVTNKLAIARASSCWLYSEYKESKHDLVMTLIEFFCNLGISYSSATCSECAV